MQKLLSFELRTEPVPQGSMRAFTRRTGGVGMTPTNEGKLRTYRNAIGRAAQAAGAKVSSGALAVNVTFNVPKPKSRKNEHFPHRRPDVDKLLRAVLDALTGVAYHDDGQVCEVVAVKQWHPEGFVSVEVEVYQLEEPVGETA